MAEQLTQDFGRGALNSKVWLENRSKWDWTEEFRGRPVTIKANDRILMNRLEAERLKGIPKPPAQYTPHGELAPGSPPPKALHIVELTEKELLELEGKSFKDLKKEAEEAEKKAKSACAICGVNFTSEKGMKLHLSKMHPEYEPVSSE